MDVIFKTSDILCCSETWLSKQISDFLVSISDKVIYRQDRNNRGGGVCIYVNQKLAQYCKIDINSSFTNSDLEIVTINITKPGNKYAKVSSVYRPPRGDHKKCITSLSEILLRKENFKKEIWLLGDFNVDHLNRHDINFKRFQTFFKTYGLTQLINDPTRPGKYNNTCLDWIVTNSRFVSHSSVTNIFISDHFAIECTKKKQREQKRTLYRTLRDYKNYDKNLLINLLKRDLIRNDFMYIDNPNTMWANLYTVIRDILSVMCPLKNYRQSAIITPWITADIYRAMRYRDRLIALYKATSNSHYLTLAKQQRNVVNSMVESAKKLYISSILKVI